MRAVTRLKMTIWCQRVIGMDWKSKFCGEKAKWHLLTVAIEMKKCCGGQTIWRQLDRGSSVNMVKVVESKLQSYELAESDWIAMWRRMAQARDRVVSSKHCNWMMPQCTFAHCNMIFARKWKPKKEQLLCPHKMLMHMSRVAVQQMCSQHENSSFISSTKLTQVCFLVMQMCPKRNGCGMMNVLLASGYAENQKFGQESLMLSPTWLSLENPLLFCTNSKKSVWHHWQLFNETLSPHCMASYPHKNILPTQSCPTNRNQDFWEHLGLTFGV